MIEPVVDDPMWIARCVARLVELDAKLEPEFARPIAEDMCGRPRWRGMTPEAAAQTVFDFDATKR